MGLTKPRASQIFDIDYKQATRVITVSNVTLTGGAPSVVDGVSLTAGDRVLVTGQSTGSENGLYAVAVVGVGSDGTWVRTSDGNEDGEIQAGMIVMVTEGTTYHDTQWKLTTDGTIDIGTTALVFAPNTSESYGNVEVATYLSSGTVSTDINTTAAISATGAITGGSLVGTVTTAAQTNITSVGALTSLDVTGNITGGNISTTGSVGSHLVPAIDLAYSLGNATHRWANLYLSGNTIYLGNSIITESANGDVVIENSGSFAVPVGTTAQRSEVQGAIRYNTTLGVFETYDSVGWNSLAYGTQTDFPFGDYGDLSTITTDSFGVSLAQSFDANAEGSLSYQDLGAAEAYVGA